MSKIERNVAQPITATINGSGPKEEAIGLSVVIGSAAEPATSHNGHMSDVELVQLLRDRGISIPGEGSKQWRTRAHGILRSAAVTASEPQAAVSSALDQTTASDEQMLSPIPPAISEPILRPIAEAMYGGDVRFALFNANGSSDQPQPSAIRERVHQVTREEMQEYADNVAEGKKIASRASDLLDAVIGSDYIKGVTEAFLEDTVRWAIAAAKNPSIIAETSITTGWGGSENPYVAVRSAGYGSAAIDLYKRLDQVRQRWVERDLEKAKARYIYRELEAQYREQGTGDITRNVQIALRDEARTQATTREFDEPTLEQIRSAAGYFVLPKLRFLFAPNAGIEVNRKGRLESYTHAAETIRYVKAYVEEVASEAAAEGRVMYTVDRPWNKHNRYTQIVLDYLVSLIEQNRNGELTDPIAQADKLAKNHANGHENGNGSVQRERRYEAVHSLLFDDDIPLLPGTNVTTSTKQDVATFQVGGGPEQIFNDFRVYLLKWTNQLNDRGNPQDFFRYVDERVAQGFLTPEDAQEVRQVLAQEQEKARSASDETTRPGQRFTVGLLTKFGDYPSYYTRDYDPLLTPEGVILVSQSGLPGAAQELYEADPDIDHPDKRTELRDQKNGIQRDLSMFEQSFVEARPGQEVVVFLESYLKQPKKGRKPKEKSEIPTSIAS